MSKEVQIMHVLPDTPMSVLSMFSTNLTSIDVMSDSIIAEVKEGKADPLAVRALLKAMEMVIERVNKETQAEQLTAADKYHETKFTQGGVEFQKRDVATSYDYTADLVWCRLADEERAATEKKKTREAFLKALKEPMDALDKETGEVVILTPPIKTSRPGLAVSIK